MSSEEALKYGIVDHVVKNRSAASDRDIPAAAEE
jgi:ATP-dependent protease ClpP protease subunit